jgi:hypothetical protein
MLGNRYDVIGAEYAATRREDPRIAALIHAALGDARTIVNVGPARARTSRVIGTSSRSSRAR